MKDSRKYIVKIKWTISLLILLIIFSCSQNKDPIIGKWKFVQVLDSINQDARHKYEEEMWFGHMTLYFKPNNHYKSFIMATNEDGIWNYDEKTKKLTLTSNKSSINQIEVIELLSNKLTVRIGVHVFLFEKTTPTEEDDIENKLLNLPYYQ